MASTTAGQRDEAPLRRPRATAPTAAALRRAASRHRPELVALALYLAVRLAVHVAGVRTYDGDLEALWQTIDLRALDQQYLQSLWYANTEPPLFNAVVGAALRWSPFALDTTFGLLHGLLGAVLAVALVRFLRVCGCRSTVAVVASVVVVANPTTILFQHWVFYEFPVAVALVVMASGVARLAVRPRVRTALLVLGLGAAACLTRAMYHPLWLVLVTVLVVAATQRGDRRRRVLVWSIVPLLVVGLFVARNLALWGTPTMSSWFGGNLARITTTMVDFDERQRWVEEGETIALLPTPFSAYEEYEPELGPCTPRAGDPPVLAEPLKTSGHLNLNQRCYLEVWDADMDAALTVLRRDPGAYLQGVTNAWFLSQQPAKRVQGEDPNSRVIAGYVDGWNDVALLTVPLHLPFAVPDRGEFVIPVDGNEEPAQFSPVIVALTLAGMAALPWGLLRWWRRGPTPARVGLTFIGLTVCWSLLVGNSAELGENHRFRYLVEPLCMVAVALAADRGVRWLRAAWTRSTPGGDRAPTSGDRPDPPPGGAATGGHPEADGSVALEPTPLAPGT